MAFNKKEHEKRVLRKKRGMDGTHGEAYMVLKNIIQMQSLSACQLGKMTNYLPKRMDRESATKYYKTKLESVWNTIKISR